MASIPFLNTSAVLVAMVGKKYFVPPLLQCSFIFRSVSAVGYTENNFEEAPYICISINAGARIAACCITATLPGKLFIDTTSATILFSIITAALFFHSYPVKILSAE